MVSVIVPCFKQGQYLSEALASIQAQTFKQWECIIVNDGSPDNTAEIASLWEKRDSRFYYFEKPNGGLASARNAGIKRSRGEFFLTWDADDLFDPKFMELAVEVLQNSPSVGYVSCHLEFFGSEKGFVRSQKDGGVENHILYPNNVACALVRRCVWDEVGGYDESMTEGFEDWDFWLAVTSRNWKCHIIKDSLFKYRRRPYSMWDEAEGKRPRLVKLLVEKHIDVFRDHIVAAICEREALLLDERIRNHNLIRSTDYRIGKFFLNPLRMVKRKVLGIFKDRTDISPV